jgi:polyisoprenoid-binding protein YceI
MLLPALRRLVFSAIAATLGSLIAAPAWAAPATYTIVSKISRVSFTLLHQGFIQLVGVARLAPGGFTFDPDDWSRSAIAVAMPTRSIDMGDSTWNAQIRSDPEWAKLWATPTIEFRSTALVRTDAMHGRLEGTLSMAGVTRPVTLQVTVNKLGINEVSEFRSVGFSATTTIQRSRWGLDAYSDLVGDDMAVQVQVEAAIGADGDAAHDITAPGVKR